MTAPVLPAGWTVAAFDTIGSTNDEAAARALAGAPEGTVVTARRQEDGRGRRGRRWESPEGNAYSSTILRPACRPDRAAQLGFAVALAVADTAVAGLPTTREIRLKWPNDVLIDGAKVAGILLESEMGADGNVAHVVVGVGINVEAGPAVTAGGYPAAALRALGDGRTVAELLGAYIAALAARVAQWRAGFAGTRADWLARAAWLGDTVEVTVGTERLSGRFAGLDDDGALLLQPPLGAARRIVAGEVFRPSA
ncbi:MAG: biotin--[acetyl-CoA-carboxylase] ligase [Rhodospirillales bacterium]|nr:MAG: biotin--[acetyl-CoA-carboxylase] ligase [Rhodospirillales bacterium]